MYYSRYKDVVDFNFAQFKNKTCGYKGTLQVRTF